jgi:hypothetical protein
VLDREVALENLLRVATDETDEVVRADRTAHRHQWLRILLRRLLGLGAELAELAGNGSDEPAQFRWSYPVIGDVR